MISIGSSAARYLGAEHCLGEKEFVDDMVMPGMLHGAVRLSDHPRARVAQEERGRGVPGWLLRFIYRPFINSTIRDFEKLTSATGSDL